MIWIRIACILAQSFQGLFRPIIPCILRMSSPDQTCWSQIHAVSGIGWAKELGHQRQLPMLKEALVLHFFHTWDCSDCGICQLVSNLQRNSSWIILICQLTLNTAFPLHSIKNGQWKPIEHLASVYPWQTDPNSFPASGKNCRVHQVYDASGSLKIGNALQDLGHLQAVWIHSVIDTQMWI